MSPAFTDPAYSLRPATSGDQETVRQLVFALLLEHGLQPDPGCTDADLGDIRAHYHERGGFFDVLEHVKAGIVGTVGLTRVDGVTCELRKMYLHPEHRGKGLGKLLLLHAFDRARELGYSRMVLETATVLGTALRLYEQHGFRPYQAAHKSCRCDVTLERRL